MLSVIGIYGDFLAISNNLSFELFLSLARGPTIAECALSCCVGNLPSQIVIRSHDHQVSSLATRTSFNSYLASYMLVEPLCRFMNNLNKFKREGAIKLEIFITIQPAGQRMLKS